MKKLVVIIVLFFVHSSFGQNQRAIDSLETLLNTTLVDTTRISTSNRLGRAYAKEGNLDKSLQAINNAVLLSEKIKDTFFIARSHFYLGQCYDHYGDYENATLYALKSYDVFLIKDQKRAVRSLNLLGIINLRLRNNDKAYSFSEQAMNLAYKIGDSLGFYKTKKNLAIIHKNSKNYTEALAFNKEVAAYEMRNKSYISLAKTYNNMAIVYEKTKKYDSTLLYYDKARALYKENGSTSDMININLGYGNLYYHVEDFDKSESYILEAKKIAEENNQRYELMNVLSSLAELNYLQGKYENAFNALSESKIISDSLRGERMKSKVVSLETKYQTQQKENEILQLSSERIAQDTALTKSRYATFGTLSVFMIFIGLGYFFWSKRKQTHRLALLENTVKISEAEKSRIGKELHDGIAGSLMRLVHDSETAQIKLSHKLLETYNEVRSLSHQLDNTSVHGELFLDRVLDVFPENSESQKFTFSITPRHLEIPEPNGTHVYRIIQELITNSIKYASATETRITLIQEDKKLTFSYTDNGVGVAEFKKGNGHKNIEDRIALMNGSLTIQTENGFNLNFEIPYTA